MKHEITHSKRLTSSQFDATKGSNIHSVMVMNRVIVGFNASNKDHSNLQYNYDKIDLYLMTSCRNYYFVADHDRLGNRSLSRCYCFLSKIDMEEFMVWAHCALPLTDPENA